MMGLMHFCLLLYPFIFKVSKRKVVYDNTFAGSPCVACMNHLYTLIPSVFIATGTDSNEWGAIVAFLCLQLVKMTELGGGLETFGYAEFPFQPLPLIPVSVQMVPVMVCLAFHLIALAVT